MLFWRGETLFPTKFTLSSGTKTMFGRGYTVRRPAYTLCRRAYMLFLVRKTLFAESSHAAQEGVHGGL